MDEKRAKKLSKFLSLILRHRPGAVGLELDKEGWVAVEDLMAGIQSKANWSDAELQEVRYVVETNNKKRFEFSDDGKRIRARQGHSVKVELGLKRVKPPEFLFHGTVPKYIQGIKKGGLRPMKRNHVHLSADKETAVNVGSRRGKPIILVIRAGDMDKAGCHFFLSNNGVWLTKAVPSDFINFKGM